MTIEQAREPWRVEIETTASLIRHEHIRDITKAIRYYAFHFDTYLNAASRNRPFPLQRLRDHFEKDMAFHSTSRTNPTLDDRPVEVDTDAVSELEEFNQACATTPDPFEYLRMSTVRPIAFERDPDEDYDYQEEFPLHTYDIRDIGPEQKEIMFDYYVATIKYHIYAMFQTMVRFSFTTSTPRTLYRGMILFPHQRIEPLRGFTSTTYYMPSVYDIFDAYIDKITPDQTPSYVILVMNVPAGVRYLPSTLCTLFEDEHEIILLSQIRPTVDPLQLPYEQHTVVLPTSKKPITCKYIEVDMKIDALLPELYTFTVEDSGAFWGKKGKKKRTSHRKNKK